jgi:hypothetical protein
MSYDWKCIGVTHEYWDPMDQYATSENLTTLFINDIGDGGCKDDKTTRDIRLLEKGLKEEPQNRQRYTFYLAQSYKDLKRYEKAIVLYKLRIVLGGWIEEVWYSHYSIGICYEALDNKLMALTWYWLAFDNEPLRREPLIRIAKLHRSLGNNLECYNMAKIAQKVTFPETRLLFIETPCYDYEAELEISIAGYYLGSKEEASTCCEYVLRHKDAISHAREIAVRNMVFYTQKLTTTKLKTITESEFKEEGFYSSSLSFAPKNDNTFYLLNRHVSYYITDNQVYSRPTNNISMSRNVLWEYDTQKQTWSNDKEITDDLDDYEDDTIILGLEDVRLFKWDDELWGMGTSQRYKKYEHAISVFRIDVNSPGHIPVGKIYKLEYNDSKIEKNWVPVNINKNTLTVIYIHDPLTILEFDKPHKGMTVLKPINVTIYSSSKFYKTIRGSSPLVTYKNGYVSIVHEVIFIDNKRHYLHRFVIYNKKYKMTYITAPFFFEAVNVEYVCGFFYKNKIFTIGYSTLDRTSNICTFSEDNFNKLKKYSISDSNWKLLSS